MCSAAYTKRQGGRRRGKRERSHANHKHTHETDAAIPGEPPGLHSSPNRHKGRIERRMKRSYKPRATATCVWTVLEIAVEPPKMKLLATVALFAVR